MAPPELTTKQQRFLNYLEQTVRRAGKTPSLRQAAADMGVSHAAISQMIKTLENKKMLRRDGHYSRTIHLLRPSPDTPVRRQGREAPILGRIAAGLPLYAQEDWDGSLLIDADVFRGSNLFALRIKGDSMKNAAILDGDLVICEPRQFAENGEIIVALIHQEEATVKRFFHRSDHILLKPENPAYSPIKYNFDEILIQGIVVGVHRGPEVMETL